MEENSNHLANYLKKGLRFDNRKLEEFRKITIEYDISNNAEGSARVRFGETEVLAGVKMELGNPFPDKPGEGSIMVNSELLPMSSPEFESGPPGIDSIELARVVDRGIRESKAIDFKKLCVREGEKVWIVIIDLMSVNDAGNLLDVAALAAMAALKDAKFPKLLEKDKVDYHIKTDKKLPLDRTPVSITVYKLGDKFLVDPTNEEIKFLEGRLTVAITEEDKICAMQKGLSASFTLEEIDKAVGIAMEKSKELRKLLR